MKSSKLSLRKYGQKPFNIAVIHGGPGAPGEMAPVARELSKSYGVLEPLQTKDSIQGQIKELYNILKEKADFPVILIGWSWGAWLSFIFASKHPLLVKKLILVGSGTFEAKYTKDLMKIRLSRLNVKERKEVTSLIDKLNNPNLKNKKVIMSRFGFLMSKSDSYDPLPHEDETLDVQYDVYKKVWPEADKLRQSGKLLDFGKKIKCPVVAIQGDYEPHLPEGVKKPLKKVVKDFKFILLKDCGHHPWFERKAKDIFYKTLKTEIN